MDKNFLQSEEWRKFQESVERRTFHIESNGNYINTIEHKLPIVGNYFYVPRLQLVTHNSQLVTKDLFKKIIKLAKKEKAGWVRIEPASEKIPVLIQGFKQGFGLKIQKAPRDMQPRQVFIINISKSEEELLSEMKSKTRYNIKLAQKRGVAVKVISNERECHSALDAESTREVKESVDSLPAGEAGRLRGNDKEKYIDEFLRLVRITSKRKEITSHPEHYYREMLKIPCVKLYAAEYKGKIIAANLVSFYGDTATYLHGASDNKYRNVMAPFLLQWQAILDAKKAGCQFYDLGGVKKCHSERSEESRSNKVSVNSTGFFADAQNDNTSSWAGITRFKLGFSPKTKPVEFPGSYDIVISSWKYWVYRIIQRAKSFIR